MTPNVEDPILSERLVFTITEVAELLGISKSLAYEAARDGTLPVLKIARRLMVPRKALLAMLDTDLATTKLHHLRRAERPLVGSGRD